MAAFHRNASSLALSYLFTETSIVRPTAWHVGLFSVLPTVGDVTSNGTELIDATSPGYQRVELATGFSLNTGVVTTTSVENGTQFEFPAATGNWLTVVGAGVWDAATAGDLLAWGALTTDRTLVNQDIARFSAQAFKIFLA